MAISTSSHAAGEDARKREVSSGSRTPFNGGKIYSHDATSGVAFPFDDDAIYMFLVGGQSYANGQTLAKDDQPFSPDPLHPGWSLMCDSGPWPNGEDIGDFVDLREVLKPIPKNTNSCETVCSRFAGTIQDRLSVMFGRRQQILMAVAAQGASVYNRIKRGTKSYNEMLRVTQQCHDIADSKNKRLVVHGLLWLHGESDSGKETSQDDYIRDMLQMRQFLQEDVSVITGQQLPLRMFTYQTLRGGIASGSLFDPYYMPTVGLAQRQVQDIDPLISCIGPVYHVPENANDAAHVSVAGRVQFGEQFADVVMREAYGAGFSPLRIMEAFFIDPTRLRLEYNRAVTADGSGEIVGVDDLPGLGFEFVDGTEMPPKIDGVAAVADFPNVLELRLDAEPTGRRSVLQYAARRTSQHAGNRGGARGCIREPEPYMISSTGASLYHWAEVQRIFIR